MVNAYDYKELLAKHNVDPGKMGCVMLDTKPVPLADFLEDEWMREWEYVSDDPDKKWVKGFNTDEQHITLKYGLLANANTIKDDVDALLDDINFFESDMYIDHVSYFDQSDDYKCIIGHVMGDGELERANARLSYLPHIDTFVTYRPHVTLGYVKSEYLHQAISALSLHLYHYRLLPTGINYGALPEKED